MAVTAPSGWIRFVPAEGTPGSDAGGVIEEGKYSVGKGLAVGKYRVEIHGLKESTLRKERDPITPIQLIPAAIEAVPAAYNVKSQLIRAVEAGGSMGGPNTLPELHRRRSIRGLARCQG